MQDTIIMKAILIVVALILIIILVGMSAVLGICVLHWSDQLANHIDIPYVLKPRLAL